MENNLPQNSQSQFNVEPTVPNPSNFNILNLAVAGLLILLPVVGVSAYYFGMQSAKTGSIFNGTDTLLVTPVISPLPSEDDQVICTMDVKICPDGSSVSRKGPNCEFAECPSMPGQSLKVFTASDFPGEFKVPEKMYTLGQKVHDGSYQVFMSNTPIVIPETWDSPFVPVDVRVVAQATSQDNYQKKVESIKTLYESDSLVVQPITAGNREGVIITGVIAEGYGSSEQISQAIYKTQNGYVNFHYYPFVDDNFSHEQFMEIVKSVSLK